MTTNSELSMKCKLEKEACQLMTTQRNMYITPIKLNNNDYITGLIESNIKVCHSVCYIFGIGYHNYLSSDTSGNSN